MVKIKNKNSVNKKRGQLSNISCPRCKSLNAEQCIRADFDLDKGERKIVVLCYDCGYSQTGVLSPRMFL